MGGLSSMMGTAGGALGSGVSAPAKANVINPVTGQQTTDAYNAAQSGLDAQNSFMQALQQQQGIQNQSNVYSQLQGIANGTGPNPAQAQLAQATGANVANQAALMAGQRGSSQNTGMMARQAAQQGSAAQMNAAGQAATMEANQSMNALNSMGSLATNQVGQQAAAVQGYSSGTQGEQANLLNSVAGVNSANVGAQNGLNSANAGIIATSEKGQAGLVGGPAAMMAGGGEVPHYDAGGPVQMSGSPSGIAIAPQNQPGGAGPQSGFGKMLAGIGNNAGGSNGGTQDPIYQGGANVGQAVGKLVQQGYKYLTQPSKDASSSSAPTSNAASDTAADATSDAASDAVSDVAADATSDVMGDAMEALLAKGGSVTKPHYDDGGLIGGVMKLLPLAMAALAEGGEVSKPKAVQAMVSPGEKYLPPKDVKKVAQGANPLAVGEKIPGKAKFKGDNYSNDTVPKTLQEGGIVIPKSVLESKNSHAEAYKFVNAILAKKGHLPKKKAK